MVFWAQTKALGVEIAVKLLLLHLLRIAVRCDMVIFFDHDAPQISSVAMAQLSHLLLMRFKSIVLDIAIILFKFLRLRENQPLKGATRF